LTNVGKLAVSVIVAAADSLSFAFSHNTARTLPSILAVIIRGASRAHPPVCSAGLGSIILSIDFTAVLFAVPPLAVDTDSFSFLTNILALVALFTVVFTVDVASKFTVAVETSVRSATVGSVTAFKTVPPSVGAALTVIVGVSLASRDRSSALSITLTVKDIAGAVLADVGA